MLPKTHRIPKHLIHDILMSHKRINAPLFSCIVMPNNEHITRFACMVGKKIHKRAVIRNRVKRLLRESFTHLLPDIQTGFDIILIAKQNISAQKETETRVHVKDVLETFHIYNRKETPSS